MDIMVSVVCNAFNQEKYIAQALESFVNQEADFAYEVLIHDDASTDSTANIIREYAEKYPNIIKPYFQTENQYSQHVPITRKFQYSRAKGKYIAWCEGDDYWTDPKKLQKQVDALQAHPEADICSHRAVSVRDGKEAEAYPNITRQTLLSADQVINGGGSFVSTNSLMFRKDFLDSRFDYTNRYNLDFVMQVSGSLRGGMVFLPDVMAAYRVMSQGSWTSKNRRNTKWLENHRIRLKEIFLAMDADTDYVHTEAFSRCIYQMEMKQLALEGNWKALLSKKNKQAMASHSLTMRMKLIGFAAVRSLQRK